MLIILTLYVVLVWLVFTRFKLVKFGWVTGGVAVLGGAFDRSKLRLGAAGTATVFAENAGVIGLLLSILVWINSYATYL